MKSSNIVFMCEKVLSSSVCLLAIKETLKCWKARKQGLWVGLLEQTHQKFSLKGSGNGDLLPVRPSLLPYPPSPPPPLQHALFFMPPTDEKKMSLGDLSFFILHNLISGIQVLVLFSPNKKCLSPGRQRPSKQAAAG